MVFKRIIEHFIKSIEKLQEQKLEEAKARLHLLMWPVAGAKLTAEEATALEQSLSTNPKDVKARATLIGYYRKNRSEENKQKCIEQQLWVIENEPRSIVVSEACDINEILSPEAFEKGKKLWMQHLNKSPKDPDILMNAAKYFSNVDDSLTEKLLLQGKKIRPKDPEWSERLALLHSFHFGGDNHKDPTLSYKEQQQAYKLAKHSTNHIKYLDELPRSAFEAGDFDAAKKYCEKLLDMGKREDESTKSDCYHKAFTTLGRLELRNKNIAAAKEYLLKSADVSGSPVLNSFGPGFALAKDLFDLNEKDIVIEYLKLCSKFWYKVEGNIEKWSKQIHNGEFPNDLYTYC